MLLVERRKVEHMVEGKVEGRVVEHMVGGKVEGRVVEHMVEPMLGNPKIRKN